MTAIAVDVAAFPDARASEGCTLQTVTDPAEFLSLEAEWNEAVDRAAIAQPFVRHEWLRTWWEAFGSEARLHIVIVRAGARISAIAPFMTEHTRMYGMPVRRLRLMANDHSPRADCIVTEDAEQSYRTIWRALRAADWDVLLLNQLPVTSPSRQIFEQFAEADGLSSGAWQADESPYLPLTGSWDTYWSELPGKFRQNVRNRMARLQRIGEPRLEVLSDGEALAALEDAVRLEASGWKKTEGTAIASDDAVDGFYRKFAEEAARRGWLRLLFLTINGRRIATSYSLQYRDRLFLCKTGYDPEHAKSSPFKVLTYFAIRDAYANGLEEVDFLGNAEPWKLEWTSATRRHDWLFIFSSSIRARLLYDLKFRLAPAWKNVARPFQGREINQA
jgi:CelD/BcsL family acetyltransferase involved in cellulose biosynthesis